MTTCPYCNYPASRYLIDGITTCLECGRMFDMEDSPDFKSLEPADKASKELKSNSNTSDQTQH